MKAADARVFKISHFLALIGFISIIGFYSWQLIHMLFLNEIKKNAENIKSDVKIEIGNIVKQNDIFDNKDIKKRNIIIDNKIIELTRTPTVGNKIELNDINQTKTPTLIEKSELTKTSTQTIKATELKTTEFNDKNKNDNWVWNKQVKPTLDCSILCGYSTKVSCCWVWEDNYGWVNHCGYPGQLDFDYSICN